MGSSSGAQGKTKGSSIQAYRSIKIKGVVYNVWLRFKTGISLSILRMMKLENTGSTRSRLNI